VPLISKTIGVSGDYSDIPAFIAGQQASAAAGNDQMGVLVDSSLSVVAGGISLQASWSGRLLTIKNGSSTQLATYTDALGFDIATTVDVGITLQGIKFVSSGGNTIQFLGINPLITQPILIERCMFSALVGVAISPGSSATITLLNSFIYVQNPADIYEGSGVMQGVVNSSSTATVTVSYCGIWIQDDYNLLAYTRYGIVGHASSLAVVRDTFVQCAQQPLGGRTGSDYVNCTLSGDCVSSDATGDIKNKTALATYFVTPGEYKLAQSSFASWGSYGNEVGAPFDDIEGRGRVAGLFDIGPYAFTAITTSTSTSITTTTITSTSTSTSTTLTSTSITSTSTSITTTTITLDPSTKDRIKVNTKAIAIRPEKGNIAVSFDTDVDSKSWKVFYADKDYTDFVLALNYATDPGAFIFDVDESRVLIQNVTAGRKYKIRVYSYNHPDQLNGANYGYSKEVYVPFEGDSSGKTIEYLILKATAIPGTTNTSKGSILLAWNDTLSPGWGTKNNGYDVQYLIGGTGTINATRLPSGTTSYLVENLESDVVYQFRLIQYDADNNQVNFDSRIVKTYNTTPPFTAPTFNSSMIEWIDQGRNSADNQIVKISIPAPPPTARAIVVIGVSGQGIMSSGEATSAKFYYNSNVSDNQIVSYKLRAIDSYGNYSDSAIVDLVIGNRTGPQNPATEG